MPELVKYDAVEPDASSAVKAKRPVYFRDAGGFVETLIYDGALLRAGHCFSGPAVVESVDTTAIVHPEQMVEVDSYNNVLIKH